MVTQLSQLRDQLTREQSASVQFFEPIVGDDDSIEDALDLDFEDSELQFAADDPVVGSEDDSLTDRIEEVEAEVEALRQEREELAHQREEAARALEELESDDEEDEQPRGFFRSRRRRKKKKAKKPAPVEITELANKVKEDAENEEDEAKKYRSILSSMFGINRDDDKQPQSDDAPDFVKAEEADNAADDVEESASANNMVDADNEQEHSIDAPIEIVEPEWAKAVEPNSPEIDRSEVRGASVEESDDESERREKSRELARRLAMTSLRDVANQSARNALTEHTQRKLSRKMWVDGGLSIIALGLGGTYLTSDFTQPVSWSTYGWVAIVIGAIALIEMFRTFVRWKRATSWKREQATKKNRRKTAEDRYDKFLNQGRAYGSNPWTSQHKH
jgi:hypothetical protein